MFRPPESIFSFFFCPQGGRSAAAVARRTTRRVRLAPGCAMIHTYGFKLAAIEAATAAAAAAVRGF